MGCFWVFYQISGSPGGPSASGGSRISRRKAGRLSCVGGASTCNFAKKKNLPKIDKILVRGHLISADALENLTEPVKHP